MSSLEDSIRILLSLYVTIEQDFNALQFYKNYLSEDVLKSKNIPKRGDDFVDESITECLWFRIIIKSSSFIDEWDRFLGVKTSEKDKDRLLVIKKIVAPARKEIMKWTDLKNFRNIIAHNLRNKDNEFCFHNIEHFNIPHDDFELYHLVAFLNRMIRVLTYNYKKETNTTLEKVQGEFRTSTKIESGQIRNNKSLQKALKQIDDNMANTIWDIVRYDIIKNMIETLQISSNFETPPSDI